MQGGRHAPQTSVTVKISYCNVGKQVAAPLGLRRLLPRHDYSRSPDSGFPKLSRIYKGGIADSRTRPFHHRSWEQNFARLAVNCETDGANFGDTAIRLEPFARSCGTDNTQTLEAMEAGALNHLIRSPRTSRIPRSASSHPHARSGQQTLKQAAWRAEYLVCTIHPRCPFFTKNAEDNMLVN